MQTTSGSIMHTAEAAPRRLLSKLPWAAMLLACALVGAQVYAALPPTQHQGSVEYVSGGIGSDESDAFKAAMGQFPLALTFASNVDGHADYVSNVQVVIRDSHDASLLNTTSEGPYFLARLPAGEYKVFATYNGKTQTRSVHIGGKGTARATFEWK